MVFPFELICTQQTCGVDVADISPQPQKRPYWQSCTVMLVVRLQSTKLGCPFHDNMILDCPHISLHSWTKGWGSWCVCNSWISFILLDISSSLQHELLCTSMVADIHLFSVTFHWLLSVYCIIIARCCYHIYPKLPFQHSKRELRG
jgi:hypothetical protein